MYFHCIGHTKKNRACNWTARESARMILIAVCAGNKVLVGSGVRLIAARLANARLAAAVILARKVFVFALW